MNSTGVELVASPNSWRHGGGSPGASTAFGGARLTSASRITLRSISDKTWLTYPADQTRRSYRGIIVFERNAAGKLRITNRLPSRDYVTSVVGSETNPDFPKTELQAQAVMAQTMLARYKPGDTLGDTTEREAYLGAEYERDAVKDAVSSVWRQIITFDGRPISVYFHSTCAGGTSDGAAYFHLGASAAFPYLAARPCHFCKNSPFWRPTRSVIPGSMFQRSFGNMLPVIMESNSQKRPTMVKRATATQPDPSIVSGFKFWSEVGQKLGWDKVPGTRYTIAQNAVGDVVLESTGAGHGVGLCQWGASELARQGKTYKEILQYYFPGSSVEPSK